MLWASRLLSGRKLDSVGKKMCSRPLSIPSPRLWRESPSAQIRCRTQCHRILMTRILALLEMIVCRKELRSLSPVSENLGLCGASYDRVGHSGPDFAR